MGWPDSDDPLAAADLADSFSWNVEPDAGEIAAIVDRYEIIYPTEPPDPNELPDLTGQPYPRTCPDLDEMYEIWNSHLDDPPDTA